MAFESFAEGEKWFADRAAPLTKRIAELEAANEAAYDEGGKAAWRTLLRTAMRELGAETPDAARLALERAEAIAALRRICSHHGDNDWPDNLHLADVIEKHLARHMGV